MSSTQLLIGAKRFDDGDRYRLDMALPWDQEGDLTEARRQVGARAAMRSDGYQGSPLRLASGDPQRCLAEIDGYDPDHGPVVLSDTVLWQWPDWALHRLSDLLLARGGILVFVEPTAGLAIRRVGQRLGRRWLRRRLGHDFERDIPADLRAAGFVVTTQVRLRHGRVGDYVRGEARHFDRQMIGHDDQPRSGPFPSSSR